MENRISFDSLLDHGLLFLCSAFLLFTVYVFHSFIVIYAVATFLLLLSLAFLAYVVLYGVFSFVRDLEPQVRFWLFRIEETVERVKNRFKR